ncbi:MAG TPA: hypothetical protein ENG58_01770 [Thermotogales bacterium]|nr:hypothetical protein [Thermotogales bacterium]
MKELFKVVEVRNDEIELMKIGGDDLDDGCSGCALSRVCRASDGGRILRLKDERLNVELRKDDIVEIEVPKWMMTKLTFFVYIVPLLIFILSALFSYTFFKDEKISFYISVSSLMISALILKILDKPILKRFMVKFKVEKRK